jgi:hypothetical protein
MLDALERIIELLTAQLADDAQPVATVARDEVLEPR